MRRATTYLFTMLLLTVGFCGRCQVKIPDGPERLHMAPPPSDRFPAKWYPRVGDGTDVLPAPVLDRPYTAAVGTVTPHGAEEASGGFQARDRMGRTRTESVSGGMTIAGKAFKTKTVIVSDPVSHCNFNWMQPTTNEDLPPEMRLAFVTCGPQTLRYKEMDLFGSVMDSVADGTSTHGDTTTKTEHLAPLQMDGLTVQRLRVSNSRTDEHGQEKKWSGETWYSPELHELVRMGSEEEGYTGLMEIHRKDPDATLFYPPDGYRIELKPAA